MSKPRPIPHTPRHGSLGRGALRRHEPLDHLHEVLRVAVLPQLRHGDVGLEQPLGELVGSQLEQRATAKGGRGLLVEAGISVNLRLKLARLVGVRHDGGGEGSARPERRLRFWERLRLQERVQGRLDLHLIRAARSTEVGLGLG